MLPIAVLKDEFEQYLSQKIVVREPVQLYEPMRYILSLGGKRLRPVLTLMSCEAFGKSYKSAMDAALAVEMFHNFSLIHDDIMDAAPLRRGQMTVHEKWDTNVGILSGDLMLISAYQHFENYEPHIFQKLAKLFSQTAVKVCEGQQLDVDYEVNDEVTISQYLKMIEYKTAVLLGAALEMGGIIANAPEECSKNMYAFGKHLGIAFQLQDDYLDAFGNPQTFGKQVGGDIIANKKTFLYLYAINKLPENHSKELQHLFSIYPENPESKIEVVKQMYQQSGAVEAIQQEIDSYTQKAFEHLAAVKISEEKKQDFRNLGEQLMVRSV
jgi:geranylgeranyl diphosphate synthase type II